MLNTITESDKKWMEEFWKKRGEIYQYITITSNVEMGNAKTINIQVDILLMKDC